jgi:hypothetical protein
MVLSLQRQTEVTEEAGFATTRRQMPGHRCLLEGDSA